MPVRRRPTTESKKPDFCHSDVSQILRHEATPLPHEVMTTETPVQQKMLYYSRHANVRIMMTELITYGKCSNLDSALMWIFTVVCMLTPGFTDVVISELSDSGYIFDEIDIFDLSNELVGSESSIDANSLDAISSTSTFLAFLTYLLIHIGGKAAYDADAYTKYKDRRVNVLNSNFNTTLTIDNIIGFEVHQALAGFFDSHRETRNFLYSMVISLEKKASPGYSSLAKMVLRLISNSKMGTLLRILRVLIEPQHILCLHYRCMNEYDHLVNLVTILINLGANFQYAYFHLSKEDFALFRTYQYKNFSNISLAIALSMDYDRMKNVKLGYIEDLKLQAEAKKFHEIFSQHFSLTTSTSMNGPDLKEKVHQFKTVDMMMRTGTVERKAYQAHINVLEHSDEESEGTTLNETDSSEEDNDSNHSSLLSRESLKKHRRKRNNKRRNRRSH